MKTALKNKSRGSFFLLWGFLLWLAATVVFRIWGGWLLDADNQAMTAILFIAAVPIIYGCVLPLFYFFGVPLSERLRYSVYVALPGMLLDIFSVVYHPAAFPSIPGESIPTLAAWLLWAYSLILITGLFPRR